MSSVIKFQAPFETLKIENNESAEIGLGKAIILQAILDASSTSNNRKAKKLKKESIKWIFSDNNKHFNNICSYCKLSPQYIRKITKDIIEFNRNKLEKVITTNQHLS